MELSCFVMFFFLMIRRPPRSTLDRSSAASDVYKRQAPFPATGQWTIISGVGTLDDPSSPSATLGGFGEGVIVLEWMIDNGPCANGITRDTVVVEVFDGSSPVAAAGPDMDLCSTTLTGPITMFASSPTGLAVGTWSVQEGSGTFADVNDPFTEVTNVGTGVNTFVWTVDNGVCGITSDQMFIFMYDGTILDADAGLSGTFCDHEFTGTNLEASPVNLSLIHISEPTRPY